ncbi:MAG: sensor domain-containing diguanylate cyclase [Deltaproteobacteria bacterium]|nr:MAG: sensor domain-containing diguanylate cyclase [Deltaproteobacteria bacterium]
MDRVDLTSPVVPPAPERRALHVAFTMALAVLGWGLLAAATVIPGWAPASARASDAVAVAAFLLVIVVARRMALPMLPQVAVSLDTGFLIAAAVCLGSVTSGWLVAVALSLDAFVRRLGERRANPVAHTWLDDIAYVLYFGGMSGALLMGLGWLLAVDGFDLSTGIERESDALGLVFALGGSFLAVHYAVQGVRLRILGRPFASYVRRVALPGIVAEASLLPLAVVVVLLYRRDQPLGFLLLAATYLLINLVFFRLRRIGLRLQRRVVELETLNATSRELAKSLQLHDLVDAVARETVKALPRAELLTLVHRTRSDEAGERLVVDAYERDRGRFERFHVAGRDGPSGWVLDRCESLMIADLRRSPFDAAAASGVRSWLGVPLVVHGEAVGVLAVQSRQRGAFDTDDRRLLEAIGAQAAVALQNAHLYELAMVDGLTRLFVRRYFDARLAEEIERARRFGTEFSVVMMDIDDFKQLNDSLGHPAGDAVLVAVADIVRRNMRGVDTAARYGGEEISIVLPRTPLLDAYNLAERIRGLIEAARVPYDGGTISVTASFGIAAYPESGEGTADDVVRRADTALYRAKRTGKNRVELYWADGERPD